MFDLIRILENRVSDRASVVEISIVCDVQKRIAKFMHIIRFGFLDEAKKQKKKNWSILP